MGKPNRRRGKKGRGGASSSTGQEAAPAETGATSSATDAAFADVPIFLRAKLDFHEATIGMESCLTADQDAPAGDLLRYKLTQWSRKKSVLNWFNAGCAKDSTAEMWVDLPNKDARKALHKMVEKDFKNLKSLSRGLDGERKLLVVHQSNASWDLESLSTDDERKSGVLLAILREQNSNCSVDEAKEMIANGTVAEGVQKDLEKALVDQAALERLLKGIESSDVAAVQEAIAAAPQLLSERIKHYKTGDAPLHVACAGGSTTIIKLLMEAGADVNQRDGKGRTALKVALAAEQCDAEGMLIQSGAIDPDADKDLQMELELEEQRAASDVEVAQQAAAVCDNLHVPDTGAAVPATPPQEAAQPANAGAAEDAKLDVKKVDTGAAAQLAEAIKPVSGAAHIAVDSQHGAAQPAVDDTPVNGAATASGATHAGGQAPVSISEIQPASPRPKDAEGEEHRMTMEPGQAEQESGVDVLMDYVQDRTKTAFEWCKAHQAVVGTLVSVTAIVLAVVSMPKRR